jgi:hypothetical protein
VLFFAEHVFGPHRAALLAVTNAQAAVGRDAQHAALTARIRQEPARGSTGRAGRGQVRDFSWLEHALADPVTGQAPVAARLRQRLAEVAAEQDSRAAAARGHADPAARERAFLWPERTVARAAGPRSSPLRPATPRPAAAAQEIADDRLRPADRPGDGLTVWTDRTRLWCVIRGQRRTWPAAGLKAAAAGIAALARPASP